jgi:hypothetical protein
MKADESKSEMNADKCIFIDVSGIGITRRCLTHLSPLCGAGFNLVCRSITYQIDRGIICVYLWKKSTCYVCNKAKAS